MYIDLWYGDDLKDITNATFTFYPNEAEYRGNLYKDGKAVGDFATTDGIEMHNLFVQIIANS